MSLRPNIISGAYPGNLELQGTSLGSRTIDGDPDAVCMIFPALSTDEITAAVISAGSTLSGTPAMQIGLQAITATGNPDGVWLTSTTTMPTFATNTCFEITFPGYTPAVAGEAIALVVRGLAGSYSIRINNVRSGLSQNFPNSKYTVNGGGSWTVSAGLPVFGIVAGANRLWYPLATTLTRGTNQADRICGRLLLPVEYGDSYKLSGFTMADTVNSANRKYGLWDSAGTKLAGGEFLHTTFQIRGATWCIFDSQPTLSTGQPYYLGLENSGTNHNMYVYYCSQPQFVEHWWGGHMRYGEWSGSAWVDDLTATVPIHPLFADQTAGGGGGGGGGFVQGSSGRFGVMES